MRKGLILGIILAVIGGFAWGSTQASRQYNFEDDRDDNIPIRAARVDAELDNIITKMNQKVLIKSTAPSAPIAGMLWYDSTNKLLKQYRNFEWVGVGVHVSTTAPITAQDGDVWYDTTNNVIKIYNGSTWDLTLPDQSGHPNSYLKTDGSAADWDQISLDANIYGTLPIANGGTGQTTAQTAIDALLPAQGAASGKFLTSSGTNASWGAVSHGLILVSTTSWTASSNGSGDIAITAGKRYMVVFDAKSNVGTSSMYLRFNNDGTSGYYRYSGSYGTSTSSTCIYLSSFNSDIPVEYNGTFFIVPSRFSSNYITARGQVMGEDVNDADNAVNSHYFSGQYTAGSAVTSFRITTGNSTTGVVYLYELGT